MAISRIPKVKILSMTLSNLASRSTEQLKSRKRTTILYFSQLWKRSLMHCIPAVCKNKLLLYESRMAPLLQELEESCLRKEVFLKGGKGNQRKLTLPLGEVQSIHFIVPKSMFL